MIRLFFFAAVVALGAALSVVLIALIIFEILYSK